MFTFSFAAVNCGPLVIPKNGSLSGTSTVFPNSIQFQCDPGFILSGSSIRTCQANGTWSGLTTLCSGKMLHSGRFIASVSCSFPVHSKPWHFVLGNSGTQCLYASLLFAKHCIVLFAKLA